MNVKIKTRISGILIALVVAAVIIVFDQWSKFFILQIPELSTSNAIEITSFFNIALVLNRGISFGMFSEHDQPLLLIAIALAIIAVLLRWLWKDSTIMLAIGVGMAIGGAIGNMIDRILYGAVVDFLDFYIGNLHWPAFNIADSFIFIGVVVLCVYSMFFEKRKLL